MTSGPHRSQAFHPSQGQALPRRINTTIMKFSPKQKGSKSLEGIKPNRNQYHKIPTELKNQSSPWKSVVMSYDPALCPPWEGQAQGPGPGKAWSSHLPPPSPSLRKFNFRFWVLFPDSIHYSWRGHEKLHLISFCLGFLLLCA